MPGRCSRSLEERLRGLFDRPSTRDLVGGLARLIHELVLELRPLAILLAGSLARGEFVRGMSDIDLLVVSPSVRGLRLDERIRLAYRAWPFRRAADIILLTPEEFERALEHSVVLRDARRYWVRLL